MVQALESQKYLLIMVNPLSSQQAKKRVICYLQFYRQSSIRALRLFTCFHIIRLNRNHISRIGYTYDNSEIYGDWPYHS